MSTPRAAENASSWLGGGGMGGNQSEVPEAAAAPPNYQKGQGGGRSFRQKKGPKRPRLRWSRELHEKFVSSVNLVGGPNEATPKTIREKMPVEGITLFQIKSHLQKYRREKMARMPRRHLVPAVIDGPRNIADEPPKYEKMDKEGHQGGSSKMSDAFHMNRYEILDGNANHLVEKTRTTGVTNTEITENRPPLTGVNLEKNNAEWHELYEGDNIKPVAPHLNSSMDDLSSDPAFTRTRNSPRSSLMFESFDEVERFLMDDGM